MTTEIFAEPLNDALHRQAAGISRNNAPGLANAFNLLKQPALDLQVLGNGLNDPVGIGQQVHVIFKVANGDKPFQSFSK